MVLPYFNFLCILNILCNYSSYLFKDDAYMCTVSILGIHIEGGISPLSEKKGIYDGKGVFLPNYAVLSPISYALRQPSMKIF